MRGGDDMRDTAFILRPTYVEIWYAENLVGMDLERAYFMVWSKLE